MLRILVTGGSGFIGCRLAQVAAGAGREITVAAAINTDSERRRCELLAKAGIQVNVADLTDRSALEKIVANQDAIIHLAAAQHEAEASEMHFRRVNVEGTRNLLQAAIKAGVKRFVHGSTIGVYGSAARGGVIDETSPLAPDNPYGRSKAEAEMVVRQFAGQLEVSIARISETYGPGDMRLLKLFRAVARNRYVTLGTGKNIHQLVYVDDLAQGLLAAASAPGAVNATYILASTETLTTDEMISAIAGAFGLVRKAPHLPLWPFDIAAFIMEKTMSPLGMRPPLHRRRLDFFRKSFRFSTQRAAQLLGFEATVRFTDGARFTAQWYLENGFF
jgi:nucleoside-diphosphate-sugar epimerase